MNIVTRSGAVLVVLAVLVAPACGDGLTLSEYAADVEALVHTMNAELDAADALTAASSADTALYRQQARRRADARREFTTAFAELEPPASAGDLHEYALDLTTRLAEAEEALADATAAATSVDELAAVWEGPVGSAFSIVDAEAIELCRAAQAYLDTADAVEVFEDVPFIPREMREVVRVAFRCTAEERS